MGKDSSLVAQGMHLKCSQMPCLALQWLKEFRQHRQYMKRPVAVQVFTCTADAGPCFLLSKDEKKGGL